MDVDVAVVVDDVVDATPKGCLDWFGVTSAFEVEVVKAKKAMVQVMAVVLMMVSTICICGRWLCLKRFSWC